jgi:hypothetical protein
MADPYRRNTASPAGGKIGIGQKATAGKAYIQLNSSTEVRQYPAQKAVETGSVVKKLYRFSNTKVQQHKSQHLHKGRTGK